MMTISEALEALKILDEGNQRSTIRNNMYIMLIHMLKAKYQPEYKNKSSWRGSIWNSYINMKNEFGTIGKGSLYKRFYIKELDLNDVYLDAREYASEETGKPIETFPKKCEWTKEQLLNREFIKNFIDTYAPKTK